MENCDSCGERGDPKNVKKYVLELISGEPRLEVETKLATYAMISLAGIIVAFSLLASTVGIGKYLPFAILSAITGVCAAYCSSHLSCYRKSISCMNGMMAGMTSGMIIGLMVGLVIGATNGMFIGSVAGAIAGIAIGAGIGRYCGVMGAMEGIMAGFMGGTMGAMLSVMMLNDNLMLFMVIAFAICIFMVGGLAYMMNKEQGGVDKTLFKASLARFLMFSVLFSVMMIAVIVYGPVGPITYF
jgi:large-conductance mechanosensitive channel